MQRQWLNPNNQLWNRIYSGFLPSVPSLNNDLALYCTVYVEMHGFFCLKCSKIYLKIKVYPYDDHRSGGTTGGKSLWHGLLSTEQRCTVLQQ